MPSRPQKQQAKTAAAQAATHPEAPRAAASPLSSPPGVGAWFFRTHASLGKPVGNGYARGLCDTFCLHHSSCFFCEPLLRLSG